MIDTVLFLPNPPLLADPVAAQADANIARLRSACQDAARQATTGDRPVVIVGGGPGIHMDCAGLASLAGFGIPGAPQPSRPSATLPIALTVGLTVLSGIQNRPAPRLVSVSADAPSRECQQVGRRLASESADATVLIAMGDGTTACGPAAPGYIDERAPRFDRALTQAMTCGDPDALLALDERLPRQLLCTGRACWQVAAAAICAVPLAGVGARTWYLDAPYGVMYRVITWVARRPEQQASAT